MGIGRFIKGFGYAFSGIVRCICEERNMRIHTVAVFYVLLFAPFFIFRQWNGLFYFLQWRWSWQLSV